MLQNAYFLAKFGYDTAENEPAKNLQKKLQKFEKALLILLQDESHAAGAQDRREEGRRGEDHEGTACLVERRLLLSFDRSRVPSPKNYSADLRFRTSSKKTSPRSPKS